MLHVFKSVLANSVASSREISGALGSVRSRALVKTALATFISCGCTMSFTRNYGVANESKLKLGEIKK